MAKILALALIIALGLAHVGCANRATRGPSPTQERIVRINPGAVVPIYVIERELFRTIFQRLSESLEEGGRYRILGYYDDGAVFVIGDPTSGSLTYREAGTLAHELLHVADCQYEGSGWAAMAAVSAGEYDLDCHGYGIMYLLRNGKDWTATWSHPFTRQQTGEFPAIKGAQ